MVTKRFSYNKKKNIVREINKAVYHGEQFGAACKRFGISNSSYYTWSKLRKVQKFTLDEVDKEKKYRIKKDSADVKNISGLTIAAYKQWVTELLFENHVLKMQLKQEREKVITT